MVNQIKCTCVHSGLEITQVDPLCPYHGDRSGNLHDAPRTVAVWNGVKYSHPIIEDEELRKRVEEFERRQLMIEKAKHDARDR